MSSNSAPKTQRLLRLGALALAVTTAACTASISGNGDDDAGPGPGPGPATGGSNNPGGGGSGSGGTGTTHPAGTKLDFKDMPAYYRVIRLTKDQWTNSVQGALRLPATPTLAEGFQDAVSGTTDFTNNELVLGVDNRAWEDFHTAAETLATEVTSDPAKLSQLYSGTDGAGFIAAVGRRFYRRPLTAAETAEYQKLFDLGATLSGTRSAFAKGASVVLRAMLQSPHFLYRMELGPVGAPLTSYEIASKLSLWLRNAGPDDALLDAAAGPGKLDTPEGVAAAAQKLVEDPAAKTVMRQFTDQYLHFDRFSELTKVGVNNYDPTTNEELEESAHLFFDRIFSKGLGVKDIFLSTVGFVGPKMAPYYGGAPVGNGFMERDLGASRLGYFMQLPFLMLYSHNDEADSIHRGVSMSLDVLCAPLGPFAGEIPPLPKAKPGQTNRMRVDLHTNGCGSVCHNSMINPLGFAFENFDGMGQYRETELNGAEVLPIDASGSFDFVGGTKAYKDAADLMNVLATEDQAHLCYAKKLASFSLQRNLTPDDLPMLDNLAATSAVGSVKQVMVELVKQDAFRVRAAGAK